MNFFWEEQLKIKRTERKVGSEDLKDLLIEIHSDLTRDHPHVFIIVAVCSR